MGDGTLLGAPIALPGLVDLQVNGWAGVDFGDPRLGTAEIRRAAAALRALGLVAFLPTVVTAPPESMEAALAALAKAAAAGGEAGRMMAGIHVEGPFISPLDGPRGAHPREWVAEPDPALAERLWEAAEGRIRIMTLAPELEGAEELVRWCAARGIVAALGHSAADSEAVSRAVAAGARLSTHLGNGVAGILPRHPNLIWDQLAEDRLSATMIADGHHLPAATMKVFARAKGDRLSLVSDSTALGGSPPGEYAARIGGAVVLEPGGRLRMRDSPGTLAGAASCLLDGVLTLADRGIVDFPTAWEMASRRPARLLGMEAPPGEVLFDPPSRRILEVRLT